MFVKLHVYNLHQFKVKKDNANAQHAIMVQPSLYNYAASMNSLYNKTKA